MFCNFCSPVGKWTENHPGETSSLAMEEITLVFTPALPAGLIIIPQMHEDENILLLYTIDEAN